MRNIKKLDWYWRSGGGAAQAFDSPAPLRVLPQDDETILLQWADILQDNSKLYRNTVDNFGSATEIYDGANKTYTDTGLSAGTTYYYYVVVSLDGLQSSVISRSGVTMSYRPTSLYEAAGLDETGTNDWGVTTPPTRIDELRDVIGSGPYFARSGTAPARGYNLTKVSAVILAGNMYFNASSTITLVGDFTVAFRFYNTNIGGTKALISNSTDDSSYFWINTANTYAQTKVDGQSKDYAITLPVGWIDLLFTRSGSTGSVSINGGTATTQTMTTANLVFNRLLGRNTGDYTTSYNYDAFLFESGTARTYAEVLEYFDRRKGVNYTADANSSSAPIFTGDWESLTNGRTSDSVSLANNGTTHGIKILAIEGYTFVLIKKPESAPTYSEQLLAVIRHSDGKITPRTSIPYYFENTDDHNAQSLFLYDKIPMLIGHDVWYGAGNPESELKVRSFGKNWNIKKVYDRVVEKNLTFNPNPQSGYDMAQRLGDTVYNLNQYFLGFARYLQILRSPDGLGSWDRMQLCDSGAAPNWLYAYLIQSDDECFVHWTHLYNGTPYSFMEWGIIRSTDLETFYNWEKTKSFTRTTAPLSLSTLVSDYSLKDVSGGTLKNSQTTNAFVTSTKFLYGGCGDGENTAWQLFYGANQSALTFNNLDFGVYSVKLPTGPGVDFNRNFILIYRTGVDAYDIYGLVDNSGAYRIAKFTTTDAGATTLTFDSYISPDDGRKYWHMQRLHNYEVVSGGYSMATSVAADGLTAEPFFFRVK